jgi:transposase-like protein
MTWPDARGRIGVGVFAISVMLLWMMNEDRALRKKQEVGRRANNRVENSDLPFRRRERVMLRFRQMKNAP